MVEGLPQKVGLPRDTAADLGITDGLTYGRTRGLPDHPHCVRLLVLVIHDDNGASTVDSCEAVHELFHDDIQGCRKNRRRPLLHLVLVVILLT